MLCMYISYSPFNVGNTSLFVCLHGCAVACAPCATKQTLAQSRIFLEGTLILSLFPSQITTAVKCCRYQRNLGKLLQKWLTFAWKIICVNRWQQHHMYHLLAMSPTNVRWGVELAKYLLQFCSLQACLVLHRHQSNARWISQQTWWWRNCWRHSGSLCQMRYWR